MPQEKSLNFNLRTLRFISAPWRFLHRLSGAAERHGQNVATAFVQIWSNKARSLLTTLGIIIAVMSTICVVAFVQSFGNYFTDMLRKFGTNMVFVVPHVPSGMMGRMLGRVTLDIDDVRAVAAQCDKTRRISPVIFSGVDIEFGRTKAQGIELQGCNEQFQSIRNFFVDEGRFFGPIDVDGAAHVCVLGREVLSLLEVDENIVGNHVYINNQRFLVLGILEPKGNFMGEPQDRTVLIPYTTAIKMFPAMARFMAFAFEATREEDVQEAVLQMSRVLRTRHDIGPGRPNDFRVFTQDEFLRDFERAKMIGTSVLGGIVGISLIVGGIGIMNIMLVSVTERTREIGLRKSIGGRRRDILLQFLTEAMVLATVGGVIGILLGYSICAVASLHPSMVKVVVPYWAVLIALTFSAGIGVLFGLIPAFKAAIIHPIEALRHE
jgi:putative ABC transport system permease protein